METKTLKIEVPNGYEIDKEKSTYENIVFKKVDDIIIKWNRNHNGVEIKADDEHFILDSDPSQFMNWCDAMRFYNMHKGHTWNLPTVKQLQVVHKYFDEINKVIKENGGFVLSKSAYWSIEDGAGCSSRFVYMVNGITYSVNKEDTACVRAVVTL